MDKLIWIIDDDQGILDVVETILQDQGYKVKKIANQEVFEQSLQEELPDLVLLDVLISGLDGREVARKLKGDTTTQNIPIVMMSADTHVEEKAEEAGVDSYLKKPFEITDLENVLQKYLTTHVGGV